MSGETLKDCIEIKNDPDGTFTRIKAAKPKKVKREKSTSSEGHFITKPVLLAELARAKELGFVTTELAAMYYKIAVKYSLAKNWAHLNFKEDLISAGVLNLLQNGLKFNPEKSNEPFSYLTQCLFHSFLSIIAEEKKQRDIRDIMLIDAGASASASFMNRSHEEHKALNKDFYGED